MNDSLQKIASEIKKCQKCNLFKGRTNTVPGKGNPKAKLMFIGEGPGFFEDKSGIPFCGAAGKLLDELLNSIGVKREDIFITNVVKCRPPGNRDPEIEEIKACSSYLNRQIELINPEIIATLGRFSMAKFLKRVYISRVHGKVYNIDEKLIIPMYHPAAGLRRGEIKMALFDDFKRIIETQQKLEKDQNQSFEREEKQLSFF